MNSDLADRLPLLIPKAIEWAEGCCAQIASLGKPLRESELSLAGRVGVAKPEMIRILFVPQMPTPPDIELKQAAFETGLLGSGLVGLTFGYGIYLLEGNDCPQLISHECRHVYQYEQAGSVSKFLLKYLQEIVRFGYYNAPYEIDARAHELEA